ncbi:LysR family transcriptional regulator [Sulfitobacter delicatus]|uniref:DNA-binding transcriptional regulator, LysR family n=1 Tax=Sulfitobacter delicatus TaxID=218672 RepID=A0A1G7UUW1_9RHOB|nr:LysR family transcriptional regulator [Sulfitobacter delicatus]SDG51266.1 DNA-binding transcriptional regulator, LysR family [Sulfitobacter delicatus]
MLNATWLETFTTLCEMGHFTRTAERLNMTQPGVSQHLRKLEDQLGQPLIVRQGKKFVLTPAGEALFETGLARRREENDLRERIATDLPDHGTVHIACSGSFAMLLHPLLIDWMQSAPALTVHLEAAPQPTIRTGLLDGRFDLGVLSEEPSHARLEARHLGEEELCLVLPVEAPERITSFAALNARGFIAHPDGFAYADDLLQANFPGDYPGADRLKLRGYINQIGQIPAAVARGVGYTLLPRSGVETFAAKDLLRQVTLPQRRWHGLWLAQRRGRPLAARLERAAKLIAEAAERIRTG